MRWGLSGWVAHSLVLEGLEQLYSPRSTLYIPFVWRNGTLWSSQYYLFLHFGVQGGRGRINFNTAEALSALCVSAVQVTTEE